MQQSSPKPDAETPPPPEEGSPGEDMNAAGLLQDVALLAALRQGSPPPRTRSHLQSELQGADAPQGLIRGDLAAITARSRGCFCKNSRRACQADPLRQNHLPLLQSV